MGHLIRRAIPGALVMGLLLGAALAGPIGVAAKSGEVIKTGSCSSSSDWKLKVKPDNGRLEVQFEVDQNRNGQTWNVKLKRNGNVFWSGQKVTQAPSGSFSVTKRTRNGAGTDKIVGKATNPKTGEVCRGVSFF